MLRSTLPVVAEVGPAADRTSALGPDPRADIEVNAHAAGGIRLKPDAIDDDAVDIEDGLEQVLCGSHLVVFLLHLIWGQAL